MKDFLVPYSFSIWGQCGKYKSKFLSYVKSKTHAVELEILHLVLQEKLGESSQKE